MRFEEIRAPKPRAHGQQLQNIVKESAKASAKMGDEEKLILSYLNENEVIEDTLPWSDGLKLDHKKVVGSVKSLSVDQYVLTENLSRSFFQLTEIGSEVVKNGSQEYLSFLAIREAGKLSIEDLQTKVGKDVAKVGMGNCMKNKWIKKDGSDLVPAVESPEDIVQKQLMSLNDLTEKVSIEFRLFLFYSDLLNIILYNDMRRKAKI